MRFFSLALLAAALVGCQSPPPRAVVGQLSSAYLSRVDNPVIIARTIDRHAWVAHVSAGGAFRIDLPANRTYRLELANTTRSGVYHALARIPWPGGSNWARLGAGNHPVSLGLVRSTRAMKLLGLASATGLHPLADEGDMHGTNPCGAAQGECIEDVNQQDGLQECNIDNGDVGNTDDGQVTENVEVVADSPAGDLELNQDSGGACTGDTGGSTGGGSTGGGSTGGGGDCTVDADCQQGLRCFASHCSPAII